MGHRENQGYSEGRTLLRVREVAGELAISRNGVYRLIAAGLLSPIYIDSHPRFEAAEVVALIAARRAESSEAART